jgi:ribosomal protein S18 acetylase RimI-like enzyme
VPAELLAMAVAPAVRGQGLAHRLGGELLHWAAERGLPSMKVVVGSGNQSAIKVYRRLGFEDAHEVEVHEGETSLELVWIH